MVVMYLRYRSARQTASMHGSVFYRTLNRTMEDNKIFNNTPVQPYSGRGCFNALPGKADFMFSGTVSDMHKAYRQSMIRSHHVIVQQKPPEIKPDGLRIVDIKETTRITSKTIKQYGPDLSINRFPVRS